MDHAGTHPQAKHCELLSVEATGTWLEVQMHIATTVWVWYKSVRSHTCTVIEAAC